MNLVRVSPPTFTEFTVTVGGSNSFSLDASEVK